MYINSGDDDDFFIEAEATRLYTLLRKNGQPAELRIVDGAHRWPVWESTIGDAMRYLFRYPPGRPCPQWMRKPANRASLTPVNAGQAGCSLGNMRVSALFHGSNPGAGNPPPPINYTKSVQ